MADNTSFAHSNKIAVMHVLAGLIKNPLLFSSDEYKFDVNDFPEQFHRIVFGAVEHLAINGMEKIDYIDIDQFLKQYPVQYKVFTGNDGSGYISRILKLFDEKKFDYYYQTVKKHSLLNKLNTQGISTKEILDPEEIDPTKIAVAQEKFDALSVNDILDTVESKMILIKEQFGTNSDLVEDQAGNGILELIERYKEVPEIGLPYVSPKLTTIFRGLRLGTLYMESSAQGVGKSRRQASESAHLAVPEYYDLEKKQWIKTGFNEKVLLISTELELSETQTMWLAYVSGVPEEHIIDGKYLAGEEERVIYAGKLIKQADLHFVSITNYNIDDIINLIKKYHQLNGVNYIFYDYLSTTIKIMAEGARKTKMTGLREDQILLTFVTELKDLAKKLQLCIFTATQLSGNWKTQEADAQLLRGAKALSDKPDGCSILLPIRESDKEIIDTYTSKGFNLIPTHVIHVFKVRRSHYNNLKLYVYFDRATCRLVDCFAADSNGNLLAIEDTNIELILDNTKETKIEDAIGDTFDINDF